MPVGAAPDFPWCFQWGQFHTTDVMSLDNLSKLAPASLLYSPLLISRMHCELGTNIPESQPRGQAPICYGHQVWSGQSLDGTRLGTSGMEDHTGQVMTYTVQVILLCLPVLL